MRRSSAPFFVLMLALVPSVARADDAPKKPVDESPGTYINLFSSLSVGKGLRFNNPYRLSTEIGADAKSVSATAAYVDFAANMTFGAPRGFQDGLSIHIGGAVEGVPQTYLSFSDVLVFKHDASWMAHARVGPALLLTPDFNVGAEVAGGFSYFFTGAIGLTSELAVDVFYGAATLDKTFTTIPTLSGQLGIIVDFEVLP